MTISQSAGATHRADWAAVGALRNASEAQMDRNEIHPEIEALLEELGRALATELEGREVFAASCQIGRVLWFGRWWVEIAPGKFIPDDFEA